MKNLLNNLSEEEKNSIRRQHEGGMKVDTSRFKSLLENKMGNVRPLVEQYTEDGPATEDEPLAPMDELEEDHSWGPEETDDEDVLTVDYILDDVKSALDDLGGYNDSMEDAARELAKDILLNIKDDLAYLSENYEDALQDILDSDEGNESEGEEEDEEEDELDDESEEEDEDDEY